MKESKVTISYIIPAFNAQKNILKLITYLDNVIDHNDEIIVINDGSTDSTKAIVESYISRKVRLYNLKVNSGVSTARNKGIDLASNEYMMFLDADDSIERVFFTEIKNTILKYNYPNIIRFSNSQAKLEWPDKENELPSVEIMKLGYKNSYYLHTSCTQVISTSFLLQTSVKFDETKSYGEDLLFSYNLLKNSDKCVVLPDKYYIYNFEVDSASNSIDPIKIARRINDITSIYQNIFESIDEELLIIMKKKYFIEVSMQMMKMYRVDSSLYKEFLSSYKENSIEIEGHDIKATNIYEFHFLLMKSDKFYNKILLGLLLNSYKILISFKDFITRFIKRSRLH